MKAGFYECDITPSIGMERPATYHKIFIEKINDPLKARSVVFDNGKNKVALIVAIPGELFCGIGLEIKKNSKFPFTWVSSLDNDIPTPDVPDSTTGGGYESRLTIFTCCVPEAADNIVRKVSEMMKEFTHAPVPEGPKIEPVTTVWEFGNCPPVPD